MISVPWDSPEEDKRAKYDRLSSLLGRWSGRSNLRLNNMALRDEGVVMVTHRFQELRPLHHLQRLELRSNEIRDRGMGTLCDWISTSRSPLKHLNLWNNEIGPDGAGRLARILNASKLEIVNLGKNKVSGRGC